MNARRIFAALAAVAGLGGCMSVGPAQLKVSQVDYACALGDAKKRQILATIVGLRFADAPAFLTASQIIVGYDLSASGGPTLNTRPGLGGAAFQGTGAVSLSYSSHPTFTFSPATGEAYANFIRPLPPTLILPLANSQIPIDVLLRITVQSIGSLQNGTMLGEPQGSGSPGFFQLLATLRRLQLAGAMAIQYKEVNHADEVFLAFTAQGRDRTVADEVAEAKRLLGVPAQDTPYRIGYGEGEDTTQVPTIRLATRSVLGILGNLGAEVQVAGEDVAAGATKPTIQLVGGEARPTILVHSGTMAPADAYVSVTYGKRQYWIDRTDFDSKYAFTVVQDLMALAESSEGVRNPIVTIPAS